MVNFGGDECECCTTKRCEQQVAFDLEQQESSLKIDDRKDKNDEIENKIEAKKVVSRRKYKVLCLDSEGSDDEEEDEDIIVLTTNSNKMRNNSTKKRRREQEKEEANKTKRRKLNDNDKEEC